ncbi:MAG: site-specific DNA-methyltransferase [Betaproteobacteria bacterium]
MSTPNDNKRQQLISKLKEMFQMDQADLDFGIYRIMNAKRDEISQFLEQDLLPTLRTTLQEFQPTGLADKQKELADAIANAKKLKIDPDSLEVVQQLKAELAEGGDLDRTEDKVFSDLYTFFSRYYSEGDFLSLRRYKEGVYAMPYEGEEVKLHWANADQYFIKSAENFTRYAFKSEQGRVRLELTYVSTERDNNKSSDGGERRFILADAPLALDGDELVIYFEYRPDTEKRKQKDLNAQAVQALLSLPEGAPLSLGVTGWSVWKAALARLAATEKNKTRTLLEKHLTDYTARNSFDYFIHKDLGRFMRRELDFFVKNEVMHLDDIESESAPKVQSYLAQAKGMRQIAHKLIDFLAQLENFQKRLWLKKKFVLEANWLITLDRIPETLYPILCKSAEVPVRGWDGVTRNQRDEWIRLFAIDQPLAQSAEGGLFTEAVAPYSVPLTPEFLKAHPYLTIDTAFLADDLKYDILSRIDDLEEATQGVLVHGENFQALNLLNERYRGQIKTIYIDPPYNTGSDEFIYKDAYQRSSWLSLMHDRLLAGKALQPPEGTITVSIDDDEMHRLATLLNVTYGDNELAKLIWDRNRKNDAKFFSVGHEYMLVWAKDKDHLVQQGIKFREPKEGLDEAKKVFQKLKRTHGKDWNAVREGWKAWFDDIPVADPRRRLMRYNRVDDRGPYRDDRDISWPGGGGPRYEVLHPDTKRPCKIPRSGWRYPTPERFWEEYDAGRIAFGVDETTVPSGITRLFEDQDTQVMPSVFYSYAQTASQRFDALFGRRAFDNPKPWPDLMRVFRYFDGAGGTVLDYFAGSGSTGHAAIDLRRDHQIDQRFVLVEMGAHFDNVLKPRIQKAGYAASWEDGRPTSKDGVSQIIKYVRLESYEDACDNLALSRGQEQQALLESAPSLREGYVLNYMLEVESRDSLLNLDRFTDPFNVEISITRNDESRHVKLDLVETFNYLLGLRVKSLRRTKGVLEVTGVSPTGDQVLVLWRNTNEVDSQTLNDWFEKQAYNSRDTEFDLIYVNGDNNIENLRRADETWKVQLIEERFISLMFANQD